MRMAIWRARGHPRREAEIGGVPYAPNIVPLRNSNSSHSIECLKALVGYRVPPMATNPARRELSR